MTQEDQADISKVIQGVLENNPLYVKVKIAELPRFNGSLYSVATLFLKCPQCKQKYPFRSTHSSGGGAIGSGPGVSMRSEPPRRGPFTPLNTYARDANRSRLDTGLR
jgi:hypothetical protein